MTIKEIHNCLIKEAKKAYIKGEVPVAAVVVKDNKIISKAYNLKEAKKSVLAHAEILALEKAYKKVGNWRLDGCDIYVTLEPCSMCAAAIHQSRIDNIYYFAGKENCGNNSLTNQILVEKNCNKETKLIYLEYSDDSKNLLQEFFKNRR